MTWDTQALAPYIEAAVAAGILRAVLQNLPPVAIVGKAADTHQEGTPDHNTMCVC